MKKAHEMKKVKALSFQLDDEEEEEEEEDDGHKDEENDDDNDDDDDDKSKGKTNSEQSSCRKTIFFQSFQKVLQYRLPYFFLSLSCLRELAILFESRFSQFESVLRNPMFLDLPDPGSVSTRYGSGSFYHQAKIVLKNMIPTFCNFFVTFNL
jgi:hypothetical protein